MAQSQQPKTEKKSQDQQKKESSKKQETQKTEKTPKKEYHREDEGEEFLIRVAGYDIPGSKNIFAGLTRVKGVGWAMSNAACLKLGFPRNKKISELTKDDIKKIEDFIRNPDVKDYMKNRQKDEETGETKHFIGTDLEMKKDFDIRRMKKIRSYKGIRHTAGQPVRGQRTRSHFRKKGALVAVRKKTEEKPAAKPAGGKK
jgi:small subunit ribosomal protein S13